MSSHAIGFHLDQWTQIQPTHDGNIWDPTSFAGSTLAAKCDNPNYASNSQVLVDQQYCGSAYFAYMPPSMDPTNWFLPDPSTHHVCEDFECDRLSAIPNGTYCHPGSIIDLYPLIELWKNDEDKRIAMDSIRFDNFDDEMKWTLGKYLFEKLVDNPAMRDTDTTMYNFYIDKLGSPIEKFSEVNLSIENLPQPEQVLKERVDQYQLQIDSNMVRVSAFNELLNGGLLTEPEIAQTNADINQLNQQTDYLQNYINAASDQIMQARIVDATTVMQLNYGIITTATIEDNQQLVNDIYLKVIAEGSIEFTPAQESTLFDIAIQCPVSGGKAVYQARSMYSIIDPEQQYDDSYTCLQEGIVLRKGHSNQTITGSAFVYPNPAKDEATLVYNIGEDGTFEIFNSLGQKQSAAKLPSKTHRYVFDTGKLTNGVYYFKVVCCGENVNTNKLVIAR